MLRFQPPGFGNRVMMTSLGEMTYYTPDAVPRQINDRCRTQSTLLFLHSLGGGSSAYEWSKVYPAFADKFRVIAPDLIGWGASAHPIRTYSVDDYFTMITELIEQTDSAPVTVFAASLTAGLLIRLAIRRPDLFQRLFLVCPSGYCDFGESYRQGIAAQLAGVPGVDRLIYQLGAANTWAIKIFLEQFLLAQPARITDEIVAAYLASAQQPNAEYAALSSLRGNLCFDLALYLPRLQTPTVFFWGEKARLSAIEVGKRLQQLNSRAIEAFYAIGDAGGLPHLETPATLIGWVQYWIVNSVNAVPH
ncbi:MAG: alpha/beta hydrolase [Scytolyngbya sp. HA4215-MV1]|jgi:pimeloyl-ACP methyl ester carboxylesterase|nr:alpha/beta hydrolase [Scytolyngbya sp. HA4215-MV1]